jgi:ABC-2 type transport system ATP-binding protein
VTSTPHVELHGLTRRFGRVEAIGGLDLAVTHGELFGVVGPDGAGKTTLLRMLGGVLRPSGGDALIDGVSVARYPERAKHQLAYMSQRFGLYTDLTVIENIRFYADLYLVPKAARQARLEQLWAFSGLGAFQDRLAGALSGGMKQKLSLCCALIHQPPLLLLDEPTFGVDPISRRDLWLIIHEMVAAGTTVIASTAYLDEAERCDRVLLLHQGHEIGLDTPRSLQASLGDRVFLVKTPDPAAALAALGGAPGVSAVTRFGETIHVTVVAPSDAHQVATVLTGAGLAGLVPVPAEASLEDVFIDRVTVPHHG